MRHVFFHGKSTGYNVSFDTIRLELDSEFASIQDWGEKQACNRSDSPGIMGEPN